MKVEVIAMMISNMFNTGLLEKSLDAAVLRNEAINQNIANVDTPDYKRKSVEFEDALADARSYGANLNRTHPRHMPVGNVDLAKQEPKITEDNKWGVARLDQNEIDPNVEMAELAKNTIRYNTLIQRINSSLANIRSVINDGR